ncbi:MAG: DUF1566 domain-containing protein [Deltaproteobacteria bacterium]|nr:DUF1566 domain-containing protein [Deltaproteobacteria bacterium]
MRTPCLLAGFGWIVGLWIATANAAPPPQTSLNNCQNAVKVEAGKFIQKEVGAIATCLQGISIQLVKNNAADTSGAASLCVSQFRLIQDTRSVGKSLREKLQAGIEKKCVPGTTNTHTLADILGSGAGVTQPLKVEDIGPWCAHFGGSGTIASVQQWISCVTAAAECSVDAAISTQYPRVLEWLNAVKPKMQALSPPATDLTKVDDAVAGLDAVHNAITGHGSGTTPGIQCGSNWPSTGTAGVADVLATKTFSNDISTGLTGTMPNNGAVTLMPAATDQPIAAGYHNGAGKVSGDADLISGNIRSGVNLFGVAGDPNVVNTGSGDALGGDLLLGKKAWVAGLQVTGSMPNNGAVVITPTTFNQAIPAGYHDGAGFVVGDADLAAGNIKVGVNIFGVAGTFACGNASIDAGEECDQANLNGKTCVTQGFAGGTLKCGAGCLFDTTDCYATRFVDNLDGTISDYQTHLMWEKKAAFGNVAVICSSAAVCPNPNDADNQYTWSAGSPWTANGTVFFVFLAQLNGGGGFAGHTDWRLPTREELQGIVDYADASSPVINAAFDNGCTSSCSVTTCSCTAPAIYWSSSATATSSSNTWIQSFGNGDVTNDTRDTDYYARAVRGF